MSTNFGEFLRLRSGHGLSRTRFCIALHELEVDDQFSIILQYDGSFPQPWTRTETRRNISSVIGTYENDTTASDYVATSDEGDVYFLEGEGVQPEKIPGAGLYSDDAQGLGAINGLAMISSGLHAFGLGGQLYSRDSTNAWGRLTISDDLVRKRGTFRAIEGDLSGEAYALGHLEAESWSDPEELEEEMLKAAERGDMQLFTQLRIQAERWADEQGLVRITSGFLLYGSGTEWQRLDIGSEENLVGIFVETANQVWIVGTGGLILSGNSISGFRNISFHGDRDKNLISVTKFRDRIVIASDYALHWFDGHLLSPLKPKLDASINRGVPTPLKVQAVDDVLFYFDYKHGVHRFDGENWEEIVIPPELLERDFKGLPPRK
jgi:hypothetical protein